MEENETQLNEENPVELDEGMAEVLGTDSFREYREFMDKESEEGNEKMLYSFRVDGKGEYEGRHLSYFGSYHENNPEDEMFSEIESEFKDANPDIVFVEGNYSLSADASEEEREKEVEFLKGNSREGVIKERGESGFTAKMAIEGGVPVESPEPDFGKEIEYLLDRGFSKDHIFAFYFYRGVAQYMGRENPESVSVENLMTKFESDVELFKRKTNWEDYDYSFDHAVELGNAIWGCDLNLQDKYFYDKKLAPAVFDGEEEYTALNEIAAYSNIFRNEHTTSEMIGA